MQYLKTGKLEIAPREPDEAPCTPEQAVQLARYCPNEAFENIRQLGTWQAAKMIAEAQRVEETFRTEVASTVASEQAQHMKAQARGRGIVMGIITALFLRKQ